MNLRQQQRGTTLIMALIILLVLTVLGVAAMNTTSLEERMASNAQEINRALQAAESGLTTAFNTPALSTATVTGTTPLLNAGNWNSAAGFTRTFREATAPPREALLDPALYQTNHFDMASTGNSDATIAGGAVVPNPNTAIVQLRAGMFRVGPRSTR